MRDVRSLYKRSQSQACIVVSKSDSFPLCPLSPILIMTFMDRIIRCSQVVEGGRVGDLRVGSLLLADDVVLLAPSVRDPQLSLDRLAAECQAAGMRICTSKSEAMVLGRKRVVCLLWVGAEILPQVEEFKYLRVLFTSEGKMRLEIDRRVAAVSAVMHTLCRSGEDGLPVDLCSHPQLWSQAFGSDRENEIAETSC